MPPTTASEYAPVPLLEDSESEADFENDEKNVVKDTAPLMIRKEVASSVTFCKYSIPLICLGFFGLYFYYDIFLYQRNDVISDQNQNSLANLLNVMRAQTNAEVEEIEENLAKIMLSINEMNNRSNHDRIQMNSLKSEGSVKLFKKRPETATVDCARILRMDKKYMKSIPRIKMVQSPNQDMSCDAIKSRVVPEVPLQPLRAGIAFARAVYTDYEFLEEEVRSSYHPQNYFCFTIDKKAPTEFKDKITALSNCLPNVVVAREQLLLDSSGINMNQAHMNCAKELRKKEGWSYMIMLQNHDMIIKSSYQLATIFDLLGGANDVEITPSGGRHDEKDPWTPRGLHLFRNETGRSTTQLDTKIVQRKGASQASLSRDAVIWLLDEVNLTKIHRQYNKMGFGADEQLFPSLQSSDHLDMPGGFHHNCTEADFLTRLSIWYEKCRAGLLRHAICVFGMEDMEMLARLPNIMANKIQPDFDYVIVDCIHELMYNRTVLGQDDHPIDEDYYNNLINVQYHKNRNNSGYKIECERKYQYWRTQILPFKKRKR